jgi:hypothetical protein
MKISISLTLTQPTHTTYILGRICLYSSWDWALENATRSKFRGSSGVQYEVYIGLREVDRLVTMFVKHRFGVLEVESSQSQSLTAPNSVDFVKQA